MKENQYFNFGKIKAPLCQDPAKKIERWLLNGRKYLQNSDLIKNQYQAIWGDKVLGWVWWGWVRKT
jgi:hypothetical protein